MIAFVSDGGQRGLARFEGLAACCLFRFHALPVICPVTVWELDAALAEWAGRGPRQSNFVSLDPARDPRVLHEYFRPSKSRVVAFGNDPDVRRSQKPCGHVPESDTRKMDYTLDHTALFFVERTGPSCRYAGYERRETKSSRV